MNGMFKTQLGTYDPLQISFMRYFLGGIWVSALVMWERPRWPAMANVPAHIGRGVLGTFSGTCFFYAVRDLSLADSFTIGFLAPLFVAIFSMLFLKERPRLMDLAALALGFGGMMVIVGGADSTQGARPLFGVVAAALSAVTYALALVMLRSLAQKDALVVLVLFQHVVSAILLLPLGYSVWKTPEPMHVAVFAGAALLGVFGHLMMARAYSQVAAARLAPLEYSTLIYAATIDLMWFGTSPTWSTAIGAALIIAAALMASRR